MHKIQSSVTGSSTSISLKTQRDITLWEEPKSKENISNQLNKNTSYSLLEKNNEQLSDIGKFFIVKKQTLDQLENVLVLNHHSQSFSNNVNLPMRV